jgi:hypothetical protein
MPVRDLRRLVAAIADAKKCFGLKTDVEHGEALEEGLLRWATTEQHQEELRRERTARSTLGRHSGAALSERLFEDRHEEN